MLQREPSHYSEMKAAWLDLATDGTACRDTALEILDKRSKWENNHRRYVGLIEGNRVETTEVQLHVDMLIENVTHLILTSPDEKIHFAFLSGGRMIVEVNDQMILDQRTPEEVPVELLKHVQEKVAKAHQLLKQI